LTTGAAIPVPNLTNALERTLRSKEDSWQDRKIHASDLGVGVDIADGGTCHRQFYLRLKGAEKKEPTLGQLLMWDHGKRIEERIRRLIIEGGLGDKWQLLDEKDEDRIVELPYGIIGEYDGKVVHKDGWVLMLDYKTSRGRAFRFLDTPKGGHVPQVRGYTMAEDADGGILWYIDREGQNRPVEFFVSRDDVEVEECISVAMSVAKADKIPPVLDPKLSTKENKKSIAVLAQEPWQCSYCDYVDVACSGALPFDLRSSSGKVIGHITDSVQIVNDYKQFEVAERLERMAEEMAEEILREGGACG